MYKKKSLGQHFLRSQGALHTAAASLEILPGECVIEIGPGEGALTEHLLEAGAQVEAIEKDHRLIPLLKEKFADKNFSVIEADALEFDTSKHTPHTYKVAGNIPYYITGALIKKFLTEKRQPSKLVFLVQKEVAERIARSKKESILSLSVKAYGVPRYIKTVPRGAFVPVPNVDSAILLIEDISRKNFNSPAHEENFFNLLHAGFGSKRKLLIRNLEKILGDTAHDAFLRADIPLNARAEDVPLTKWLTLANY